MKVEYEKESCGRCGGSGRHSYNQIDRDRCYGCGGTGERLTKRGAAAKAFADSILNIKIEDAQVGQTVAYIDALNGRRTRITVQKINREVYGKKKVGDELIDCYAITLHGEKYKICCGEGVRVRLTPTDAEAAEITAYQNNLTKTGKPRQRSPMRFKMSHGPDGDVRLTKQ